MKLIKLNYFLILAAKRHINHRHALAQKLTHSNFPEGAYLLIHTPYKRSNDISNRIESSEDSWDKDEMMNDILTADLKDNYISSNSHKHKNTYRFTRNANSKSYVIEHCCPKVETDLCGKYFCH
jgi:hypothetical protein